MHFFSPSFVGDPVMGCFLLAGFLLLGGALLPLLLQGNRTAAHAIGMLAAATGCLVGIVSAVLALVGQNSGLFSIPWTSAGIELSVKIDGLAAFFLLPIFVLGFSAALYGYSYLHHDLAKGRKIAFHWFFFNVLLLSMAAVVTAANGLQFLMAWEGMSISSFFLVCYDFDNEEACRAGWLYFVATHIGVAFLFFFFLAAAGLCGSLNFESFTALGEVSPLLTGGLFALLLLGFGSKAGLFPMHVWLPDAHPAAPSHVSALMSGVMIKTAVYGLLRMMTFLPPLPDWCVITLITTALTGTVFGITMAASQSDIKRCLAYSTVENINLIFLGLGLWLFAVNAGWPVIASIALTGAMLHIWNHALIKGLLFMGAGSVLHGTGSRLFSHFGGLLRRMPVSGAMLIFGCAAIAGLPPLNGFVSELYLYMSVVLMGQTAGGITAFFALLILVLMIFVGGLVLFTVCRLSGMALLGEPRAPESARATESAPLMLVSMAILMALCLLLGVAPSLPLAALAQPLHVLCLIPEQNPAILPFLLGSQWTVTSVLILMALLFLLWFRTKSVGGTNRSSTWGCGFQRPNRRMVYAAGGFTQLAQDSMFSNSMCPANEVTYPSTLFSKSASLTQKITDPVFHRVFMPFFAHCSSWANSCRKLQAGRLNIYLLYIFISTILLLGLDMIPRP
jgi:formate hydrogenlyase subunit 3/multisubunit Na+/H+ antiporter MnhD subunit